MHSNGNHLEIERLLAHVASHQMAEEEAYRRIVQIRNGTPTTDLGSSIKRFLAERVAPMLECSPEAVSVNRPFLELGADSSKLIGIVDAIEKEVGIELYPTLFFEYQNILELSGYLEAEHREKFTAFFTRRGPVPELVSPRKEARTEVQGLEVDTERNEPLRIVEGSGDSKARTKDIAVIGMAGRFAQSPDLRTFWRHLRDRTNLITEVPQDHWDYRPWFDPKQQTTDRTYCKWGSFLPDVDKFDPLFFHMSPPEADFTDPQLRMLLEVMYETVEDAGYGSKIWGSNTGLYLGVCFREYWDEIVRLGVPISGMAGVSSALSFVANRPSYFFDLRGPSIPVDDACSSSLVALHLACRALQTGDCEMAFAAGTNLLLSPLHYVYFSAIGALSPTGRCHTFDAAADGYVPGEGIAALLLKPLEAALRDGDQIHAVIKGSALNHGGRANNPTSPRTLLQTAVVQSAWKDAGISPETVGYIEAHGTGTLIGDPIETEALKKAFKPFTDKKGTCAIGSVKANIGHTEGTAGVAGVIKAILCMKHGFIPAMPEFKELNPYLKLENSPLYVNREGREWSEPAGHPRRAGISAFAMGGAYAHVVVEEYPNAAPRAGTTKPGLFVLSATSADRLRAYAKRFEEYLDKSATEISLADLCLTLQMGRQHHEHRLAVAGRSVEEIAELLRLFCDGKVDDRVLVGRAAENKPTAVSLIPEASMDGLRKAGRAWVEGAGIDWRELRDGNARVVSLPTYPFERRSHWFPAVEERSKPAMQATEHDVAFKFSGKESLLEDHRVFGAKVLPGVSQLRMVLNEARRLGLGETGILRDVMWKLPGTVEEHGAVFRVEFQDGAWTLRSEKGDHSTGRWERDAGQRVASGRVSEIQTRLRAGISADELYRRFSAIGIEYGRTFRVVRETWIGLNEALIRFELDPACESTDPALDAMFQAILPLYREPLAQGSAMVPFSVAAVWALPTLPTTGYVHVHAEEALVAGRDAVVRAQLFAKDGSLAADFQEIVLKPAKATARTTEAAAVPCFIPRWRIREGEPETTRSRAGSILVFRTAYDGGFSDALERQAAGRQVVQIHLGRKYEKVSKMRFAVDAGDRADFARVLKEIDGVSEVYFLGGMPLGGDAANYSTHEVYRTGVLALLRLCQSLESEREIGLKVITRQNYAVTGNEAALYPEGELVIGLAKVAGHEHPRWRVSCIDVDKIDPRNVRLLDAETGLETALRNGQRHIRELHPITLPAANRPALFREEGRYLIAGGRGGLGFALAVQLHRKFRAKCLLVGRSALSDEESRAIREIDAEYFQADLGDDAQVQRVVDSMRERFGAIHGVVHSALTLSDRSIRTMGDEDFLSVLRPKVDGSRALERALRGQALDFCLYFSSLNSLIANASQSNYVAGCAFQDAFAERLRQVVPYPVVTVNWGLWGEVGIMARSGMIERLDAQGVHPIGVSEGMDCLRAILESRLPQVAAAKIEPEVLRSSGLVLGAPLKQLPAVPQTDANGIRAACEAGWKRLESSLAAVPASLARLNDRCAATLLEALVPEEQSWRNVRFGPTPPADWLPKYARLWTAAMRTLEVHGMIAREGDHYRIVVDQADLAKLKRNADNVPGFEAHAKLARVCLEQFINIVTGRIAATEVIFPDSSMALVEPIYAGNPVADACNQMVAEGVVAAINARLAANPATTFRILEIGAGTGGTTRFVCEALAKLLLNRTTDPAKLEYFYTDVSEGFIQHGKQTVGSEWPFLRFQTLDIEKCIKAQGFEPHSYDVVVASNVLHATRATNRTLTQVKELLKRNGILILNELTEISCFATVTFGLLDGWWLFDDPAFRLPGSPLLDAVNWQQRLRAAGFEAPDVLADVDSRQAVIMASSDGVVSAEEPQARTPEVAPPVESPRIGRAANESMLGLVQREIAATLRLRPDEIHVNKRFSEYGIDSILSVDLINRLNKALGLSLRTTVLFDYSSAAELAGRLDQLAPASPRPGTGKASAPSATHLKEKFAPVASNGEALAAVIAGPGGIDDLQIKAVAIRPPGAREIRIRIRAFSLNFGDWLCVRGLYPSMPEYPFTPGFEVSGEIESVGDEVTRFEPGDCVVALTGSSFGGHAEVINVDERLAVLKPNDVPFEDAAAYPVVFLTAQMAAERARIRAGESVLIQTAAGGTGLMLVQLAQEAGARIFATAGHAEKLEYLKNLGVEETINYRQQDFAAEILRRTNGRGVDVVFNTLAGDAIQKGLDLLAPSGRYVEIALTGLKAAGTLDFSRLTRNQAFGSVNLFEALRANLDEAPALLEGMLQRLREGRIRPKLSRVFEFAELKDAYRALENGSNIGKIVVRTPERTHQTPKERTTGKIAIVGMAGRFPGAKDLDAFWQNLAAGRSAITEVPAERWPLEGFYDPNPAAPGRSVCKWGGFLDDIDRFDPLFFNISGREAERMDPQQRLFLETAWHTLEHAGYPANRLNEARCGLFVGAAGGDYYLKLRESGVAPDGYVFTGNQPSILAARLAYHLNLKGPAMAVDTACSSSLVAIHLACQAIRQGEIEMALAGGVFINTTPEFHLLCSKAGMLSPQGACRTFDDAADGFVPGEAVGAVLLKPLEKALADGDNIYGVILGSGLNQDGRTNGITAPSAVSQTSLELEVYRRAGVDPATITYVEAHGTGTKLGDPIEIEALTNAFRSRTSQTGFCSIGSVKTNIGHAATAAGIASLLKVLLGLKHAQIPPSINFAKENRQLRLGETPFKVSRNLERWEPTARGPRRAAISSFGFSGTNCHLIVEEPPQRKPAPARSRGAALLVLSGKTEEALAARIQDLRTWVQRNPAAELGSVARSLACCRDHFEHRAGFVTDDLSDLARQLGEFRLTTLVREPVQSGVSDAAVVERALREAASPAAGRRALEALAGLYVSGVDVPWERLYSGKKVGIVALPGYPFAEERYWVPNGSGERKFHAAAPPSSPPGKSLIHLSGSEEFLRDHVIAGESILPAVVLLDWARKAVPSARQLTNCVWLQPARLNESDESVVLNIEHSGGDIAITSAHGCHFRSTAQAAGSGSPDFADFAPAELKARCRERLGRDELYELFAAREIAYGPSFRTVHEVWCGEREALAFIDLQRPAASSTTTGWAPGLLDGALQSAMALMRRYLPARGGAFVPYGLASLDFRSDTLPARIVVHTRLTEQHEDRFEFDLMIGDENGRVLLALRGFGVKGVPKENGVPPAMKAVELPAATDFHVRTEELLRQILAKELRIAPGTIRAADPFEKFGIDSIMVNEFNILLEKTFGPISKTIFFECKNLRELAAHFVEHHPKTLRALLPETGIHSNGAPASVPHLEVAPQRGELAGASPIDGPAPVQDEDIAIIGMAGRFPKARDVNEFWENLRAGRDCTSEIPAERWDQSRWFDPDPKQEGKCYTRWGAFIEDFDQFDPLFFKISPQEAELMDPQERHFLEIAYLTMADAGYTPESLRQSSASNRGKDIGVFVGVMWGDYQLYGGAETFANAPLPWSAYWSIANRVSYTFDFQGPSLAIDSACSSSLTAIHLACESLHRGQCRTALAGGVNLSLHPNKYRQLCQMKFASTDGKCRSFGAGGNGYVPGEGVGAVLLKPLSQAVRDGDQIYGVIKATGVNHGGKTNGYSVPNPLAQANLIADVIERSGVAAESISYVEAHGTGTSLGDPIEVTGLTRAFAEFTPNRGFCALGSAKSNIGHLEAAAGIAATIKVLLQMKHRQLAPSLHCETVNPNIRLEDTPFRLQRELVDWVSSTRNGQTSRRTAGVSSFGAGGANAHLIIEEFTETRPLVQQHSQELIVLSARTDQQLKRAAEALREALLSQKDLAMDRIAWTLQDGRESMPVRLAFCACDIAECSCKLARFLAGDFGNDLWTRLDPAEPNVETGPEEESYIVTLSRNRKLDKLATCWLAGHRVAWAKLHGDKPRPVRLPLPAAPFARQRYWITEPVSALAQPERVADELFYTTRWEVLPAASLPAPGNSAQRHVVIFDTTEGVGSTWSSGLAGDHESLRITRIVAGRVEPATSDPGVAVRPACEADYDQAMRKLAAAGTPPTDVLMLWPYRAPVEGLEQSAGLEAAQRIEQSLLPLFLLTKALQSHFYSDSINVVVVSQRGEGGPVPIDVAMGGFATSARRERPNHRIRTLAIDEATLGHAELDALLWSELNQRDDEVEVRRGEGKRWVRRIAQSVATNSSSLPGIRKGGVYLLTGGLGELGIEFARRLREEFSARVILLGRSPLDAQRRERLNRLGEHDVKYAAVDISRADELESALKEARADFGPIQGVLHLACVVEDALVFRKTAENFRRVLVPKVDGTLALDWATRNDPLDFFVSFSSAVALTGNAGQTDYGAACRFQDAFAETRDELRAKGLRAGRSISIGWSQWERAGHFASREGLKRMGVELLTLRKGWLALQRCLSGPENFQLVIDGDQERIRALLGIRNGPSSGQPEEATPASLPTLDASRQPDDGWSEAELDAFLTQWAEGATPEQWRLVEAFVPAAPTNGHSATASVMDAIEGALKNRLKLTLSPADRRKPLTDFGLDSINAVKLADDLQQQLGVEVNPKLFWDSANVEALAEALTQQRRGRQGK